MGAFIFLILFWVFSFQTGCHASKFCGAGPYIHYPFQIKGQQAQYGALPGFELLCKDNVTIIHFPSYGDLVVKSIYYGTKKIDLLDPKNCTHQVFLNLDLSLTPFHYYYVLKNYTYLNCSTSLSPRFMEVPCLSGSSYHVYTVDPALPVPGSCKVVKTVAIPFAYSPYITDNSLGLRLTWDLPEYEYSQAGEQTTGSHTVRVVVPFFGIWVLLKLMKCGESARNCDRKGQLLQSVENI